MTTSTPSQNHSVTGIVLAVLGAVTLIVVGLGIAFAVALSQAQF